MDSNENGAWVRVFYLKHKQKQNANMTTPQKPPLHPRPNSVRAGINKRRYSLDKSKYKANEQKSNDEVNELHDLLSSSFLLLAESAEIKTYGRDVDPNKSQPTIQDCIRIADAIGKTIVRKRVLEKYNNEHASLVFSELSLECDGDNIYRDGRTINPM